MLRWFFFILSTIQHKMDKSWRSFVKASFFPSSSTNDSKTVQVVLFRETPGGVFMTISNICLSKIGLQSSLQKYIHASSNVYFQYVREKNFVKKRALRLSDLWKWVGGKNDKVILIWYSKALIVFLEFSFDQIWAEINEKNFPLVARRQEKQTQSDTIINFSLFFAPTQIANHW